MDFLKKKNKLKAVYDDDLVDYLKSLNLYDGVTEGKFLCKYCGNRITIESLEVMVPKGNKVEFICDNENCLNQL